MNSFGAKDRAVAIVGGIAVVAYLAAIALTPAHAPNSGSTGVQIVRYATVNRDQLLASDLFFALGLAVLTVFAAGLYRIIRRAEDKDSWLAIASLASVVAGAGIFGPAPRCSWSSRTGRSQIPPWPGRSGTPAGWPTTPRASRLSPGSWSSQ